MKLPFEPQTFADLRSRYKSSVQRLYNPQLAEWNDNDRPGCKRENVFDFEHGLRLIISREIHNGRELLHVSASFSDKYKNAFTPDSLLRDAILSFRTLSGDISEPVSFARSNGGIPHWYFDYQATRN